MAQIFISHSKKDKDFVDFFSKTFATTKVKAIFEEFEKILTGKITRPKVERDIETSNAIFVILSQNVESMPHTRDWVVWETGVAKNKDIWIFEPYSQFGRISVLTPSLRHYVIFDTNDACLGYIEKIIESYDDSHIAQTVLIGGGIGMAFGKVKGAVIGGGLAAILASNKSKERPTGIGVTCKDCCSSYNIHIPQGMNIFRCPVCNKPLKFKHASMVT